MGLIRRVKQGLGRPAKIYVLRFMGMEDEPGEDTPESELRTAKIQTSEKPKSRVLKNRSLGLGKTEVKTSEKPSVIRLIRIILS